MTKENTPKADGLEEEVIEIIPGGSDEDTFNANTSTEEPAQKDKKNMNQASEEEKYKNEYLYLRAEFDNYRKQTIKERSELIKYGNENLIRNLLNVLDIFNRALESDVNAENFLEFKNGIDLTAQEFTKVLDQFGVKELGSIGDAYDPAVYEALSAEATTEVKEGHIFRIFKKAYKLHEKVIRPGQVVVAKGEPKTTDS